MFWTIVLAIIAGLFSYRVVSGLIARYVAEGKNGMSISPELQERLVRLAEALSVDGFSDQGLREHAQARLKEAFSNITDPVAIFRLSDVNFNKVFLKIAAMKRLIVEEYETNRRTSLMQTATFRLKMIRDICFADGPKTHPDARARLELRFGPFVTEVFLHVQKDIDDDFRSPGRFVGMSHDEFSSFCNEMAGQVLEELKAWEEEVHPEVV